MLFVDGENVTARGQEISKERSLEFEAGQHFKRDVYLWPRGANPRKPLFPSHSSGARLFEYAVRAYYYTSTTGDDSILEDVRKSLWELHFTPSVFRKSKGARSKGVDITLTKDMLSHAFHGHYDVAVLCTGDGDYVPVVEEVKRMGKIVHLLAFASGLNPRLKYACDDFFDLAEVFNKLPIKTPSP
jgi:uncharacterized LabA/DUF88 family protein